METRMGPMVKMAKPRNHGEAKAKPAPLSPLNRGLPDRRRSLRRNHAGGMMTRGRKQSSGHFQSSGTPRPFWSVRSSSYCTASCPRRSASSGS